MEREGETETETETETERGKGRDIDKRRREISVGHVTPWILMPGHRFPYFLAGASPSKVRKPFGTACGSLEPHALA